MHLCASHSHDLSFFMLLMSSCTCFRFFSHGQIFLFVVCTCWALRTLPRLQSHKDSLMDFFKIFQVYFCTFMPLDSTSHDKIKQTAPEFLSTWVVNCFCTTCWHVCNAASTTAHNTHDLFLCLLTKHCLNYLQESSLPPSLDLQIYFGYSCSSLWILESPYWVKNFFGDFY